MGDYSRLLTKMGELQSVSAEYETLMNKHKPAYSVETRDPTTKAITGYTDKYNVALDKNAITTTKYPLVIQPGDDYGEFWKYIGKVEPATTPTGDANAGVRQQNSARKCWHLAAGNPRLFMKVVYTGINNSETGWNNLCYGLVPDASGNNSVLNVNTDSPGYVTMVGNGSMDDANPMQNGIYTKLGIKSANAVTEKNNVASAMKINDLQLRINGLTREIVAAADAGINNELDKLVTSAADSDAIIGKINDYMNDGVVGIGKNYLLTGKRKELNNIYADINEQTTLRSRKYQFVFYVIVFVLLVIVYWSYTSKMSIIEQYEMLRNYVGWEWWTYWWIVATVVILLIASTIGWDIKGYIITAMNYLTDPSFWTGQLWWVGISFLMLIVIFFYATFKSFFSGIGDGLTNAVTGDIGDS